VSAEYIPGSCNIGNGEVRRRQLVAIFGLFLTSFSAVTILATDQSRNSRLSIFVPALIVQSTEDRKADRKTAVLILFQSAALAALITAVFFALPL
jgi:hypothetical protein